MILLQRILIIFILLANSQAQSMWKLSEQVQKQNLLSKKIAPAWDELLLDAMNLDGFLEQAALRKQNPNLSISSSQETALTLACKLDMSGEKIKKLLDYGGIIMNAYKGSEGIWSPLYVAVQEENWVAVNLFVQCERLPLSRADFSFAIRSILKLYDQKF